MSALFQGLRTFRHSLFTSQLCVQSVVTIVTSSLTTQDRRMSLKMAQNICSGKQSTRALEIRVGPIFKNLGDPRKIEVLWADLEAIQILALQI